MTPCAGKNRRGNINKNTFHVELETDEGKQFTLSLYSPKLKVIRKFEKLDETSTNSTEETAECISLMLSRNKENIKVSTDDVLDIFDIEDMALFIEDFFGWIGGIKKK